MVVLFTMITIVSIVSLNWMACIGMIKVLISIWNCNIGRVMRFSWNNIDWLLYSLVLIWHMHGVKNGVIISVD